MDDPYKILNIPKESNKEEIKKAYRTLILKYHPDKNSTIPIEKFIEIQTAYEILQNDKYNLYLENKQSDIQNISDSIKSYIYEKYPNSKKFIQSLIEMFTHKGYDDFRTDLLNINLVNIYKTLNLNIPTFSIEDLHIIATAKISIKFLWDSLNLNNEYINKITFKINRTTKEQFTCTIPLETLNNPELIYINEGETDHTYNGNLTILLEHDSIYKKNKYYYDIKTRDIYTEIQISLYEYLYGGTFEFEYLDDTLIKHTFNNLINTIPIITFENKGLPKNDKKRGNLYINLQLKNINDDILKNEIKRIS